MSLVRNECVCPICLGLVWQARACSLCENVFCKKCIDQSLEKLSTACPLCRRVYREKAPSIEVQTYLSNLKISCRNLAFGCEELVAYADLDRHQTQTCRYPTKECSICNDFILVNDFIQHEISCQPLFIQCSICSETIHRQLLSRHHEENHTNYDQDYSSFEINFSDTMFVDFIDMDLFLQSRKRSYFHRFISLIQFIYSNMKFVHLILFNLFIWSLEYFLLTQTSFIIFLIYIFLLVQIVHDVYLIVILLFTFILLSSLNSKFEFKCISFHFEHISLILFVFSFSIQCLCCSMKYMSKQFLWTYDIVRIVDGVVWVVHVRRSAFARCTARFDRLSNETIRMRCCATISEGKTKVVLLFYRIEFTLSWGER